MGHRGSLNNLFSHNRKILYVILSIVMVSVLTLTVVYAALSTTLNINGQAEVTAASWDIHLDNVQLNSSSATTTAPIITNSTTATFTTTLSKPGDFYEFTIDVVNDGTIDAMIDGVTKTPTLTETQAKYLNYIVEYQNGEPINNKQLVVKNSFVRLKVRIGFRSDISSFDIPQTAETLNLSFKVNYIQSDETGTNVKDNGLFKLNVVSGNLETVGSEVAIGDEHFYIISSDEDSVTMLAKYNLYVGGSHDESSWTAYGDEATGIQDSSMLGYVSGQLVRNGTTVFSSTNYWSSTISTYPAYVYNENSILYNYVENYRTYLESQGAVVEEARLIKMEELESLGCSKDDWDCLNAPSWVYATTYWSGAASSTNYVCYVNNKGNFYDGNYSSSIRCGCRPVITLSLNS